MSFSKSVLGLMMTLLSKSFERQLQAAMVVHWTVVMFWGGLMGLLASLYLMSTHYAYLGIAYFAWIYYDRNTCKRGGRRSEWFRHWIVWKYYRDYFPIRLVKSAELNPGRNYIFGCHPHGVLSIGAYCNFATEATDFSHTYPGIVPHLITLSTYFCFPFLREYFTWTGACCSSRESFRHILTEKGKGNAVVVIVGGVAEALETKTDRVVLHLTNRKGFVKMAICCGADLVPVISFGENNAFKLKETDRAVKKSNWLSRLKMMLYLVMGVCPPVFYYFCFWRSKAFALMPDRTPIVTVVGRAIEVEPDANPTDETIQHYHDLYVQSLQQLFDEYKTKFGDNFNDLILTLR